MVEHYLAACAIFRDEAPYLSEWIAFHRLVGVEHFFLYDNGSTDGPETVLEPYVDEGCVSLRSWPVPFHLGAARTAYADCLERVRGRVRWLACLDIDEFLFAPQHASVPPVLSGYEDFPGVVVHWQVYGSSGHARAVDAPVIERFSRRAPSGWIRNRRTKSIVDPVRALRPVNPHHFVYRDGALAVDERKASIGLTPKSHWKKRLSGLYRLLGPALRFFDPFAGTGIASTAVPIEHLRINHYPVKSREEYLRKARFKKEKRRYERVDYFAYHDRNDVFDPVLWQYLPALAGRGIGHGVAAAQHASRRAGPSAAPERA